MTVLDWAQVVAGVVLAIGGFFVVRTSRTTGDALRPKALPFGSWSPSVPTRYVLGISLLLLGYHFVAYALPTNWVPLAVPGDRFWMLGAGLTAACGISIGLDFLDGSGEDLSVQTPDLPADPPADGA